jgi:hypothetical protein
VACGVKDIIGALENREGFSAQYANAREIAYHGMADETLEIADNGTNDTYLDGEGNRRTDTDVVARSRLRVETRKWFLSRVLPKIYGDRVALTGPAGGPIQMIDLSAATNEQLAALESLFGPVAKPGSDAGGNPD